MSHHTTSKVGSELSLPQERVTYAVADCSDVVVGTSLAVYVMMHASAVRRRAPAPSDICSPTSMTLRTRPPKLVLSLVRLKSVSIMRPLAIQTWWLEPAWLPAPDARISSPPPRPRPISHTPAAHHHGPPHMTSKVILSLVCLKSVHVRSC